MKHLILGSINKSARPTGLSNLYSLAVLFCHLLIVSLLTIMLWSGNSIASPNTDLRHSIYAWDSQALINPQSSPTEVATLSQYGITRLYLGLSADQLQTPSQTHYALNNLIERAHAQGISVHLLLGDPDWIAPQHQRKLLTIIRTLEHIPFDGLMLDIEIEQSQVPEQEKVRLWKEAVDQVAKISPWPITSASHWRWYSKSPAVCEQNKALSSVSLMIYSTNLEVIRRRVIEAQALCPDAQISVSQSVETILPSEESWAGAAGFDGLRGRLEEALAGTGVKSIDWQDWESLKVMASKTP